MRLMLLCLDHGMLRRPAEAEICIGEMHEATWNNFVAIGHLDDVVPRLSLFPSRI